MTEKEMEYFKDHEQELRAALLESTGTSSIIEAGLIAYMSIEKFPDVEHVWKFAGLYTEE